MQIQTNTDHNIDGHDALSAHVSSVVQHTLDKLSAHITRVEVHLSDENGPKNSQTGKQNDKRCMMEARLKGYNPLAVTAQAATLHQAIDGAANKLARLVEGTLGRLHDVKQRQAALTPDGTPDSTPPSA